MPRSQHITHSLVVTATLALLGISSLAAASNTFTVNSTADAPDVAINSVCDDGTGHCTLRAAVQEANGNPGADIINFAASTDSTWMFLSLHGAGEDAAATGDLDITGDVTITGNGPNLTLINGDGADRIFHLRSGTLTLEHLWMEGGGAVSSGGGILADPGTTLELDDVTVYGNHASGSGVVQGGGIRALGDFAAQFVSIFDNSAESSGSTAFGGGLLFNGSLARIAGSTIFGNTASTTNGTAAGGGILSTSELTLQDSIVRQNTAHADSGGAYGGGISVSNGSLVLSRVELSDNVAEAPSASASGGGIESSYPTTLVNTTIAGNQADGDGGGIYMGSALLALVNVTIADNTSRASRTGGLALTSNAYLSFANTLIADNSGNIPDCSDTGASAITSFGYNLIANTSGCTITAAMGDQFGTAVAPIDPRLGPLADLGASNGTRSMLPQAGSPAIDTGDPLLDSGPGGTCQPYDQANTARPLDGDGNGSTRCDIGAVEAQFHDLIFANGFD